MLLAAMGWGDERIAQALGVTPPTLRKHYFAQLKERDAARPRVEMKLLEALLSKATDGSVPANREFSRRMHEADIASGREAFKRSGREPAAPRQGKKEAAHEAALNAGAGSEWGDDLLGGLH